MKRIAHRLLITLNVTSRCVVAMVALFVCACVRMPARPALPVAVAHVGVHQSTDSARVFLDSLALARRAEREQSVTTPSVAVRQNALTDWAWLGIINDSVLTSLVQRAVAHNRDVMLARARIQEFRALAGISHSVLLPRVAANGNVSTNQVVVGKSPAVSYNAWRVTSDVAWELDFWGRARRGLDATNADVASQQAAERATILSLVSDVALGYLQLLELDEEYNIAVRTLASRRATLALVEERYARGVVSELDVRQFEAQVAVPSARLAQVERQRAQQEHALNVLLGESPITIQRGGALIAAVRTVTVSDSLSASLLDRRPDVAQAERLYAAAEARAGVVAAAKLPVVSIAGFYGTQSTAPDKLFASQTTVYQVQAGLSVPLFTGGRQRNEVAAARARVEQARAVFERTALTALREAGDALVAVRSARDETVASETLVHALRRAVELSTLRYQSGIASYLEVLDAERGLFDAELTLSQSQLRELVAAVQLYRALGGSWVPQ